MAEVDRPVELVDEILIVLDEEEVKATVSVLITDGEPTILTDCSPEIDAIIELDTIPVPELVSLADDEITGIFEEVE